MRGGAKTQRERDYIAAIETFYTDADNLDHRTRALAYEKAMDQLQARYSDDHEAAIFHALALLATAPPTDKTYVNQKKAGAILEPLFVEQPEHPGIAHYIIHAYDYPPLAQSALDAARAVIERVARERRSPLRQLGADFRYDCTPGRVTAGGEQPSRVRVTTRRAWPEMELGLLGDHQAANAAVAVTAVVPVQPAVC